jgi:hypothetical protein
LDIVLNVLHRTYDFILSGVGKTYVEEWSKQSDDTMFIY